MHEREKGIRMTYLPACLPAYLFVLGIYKGDIARKCATVTRRSEV